MKAVYRQIIWALSICILLVGCVVFASEKGIPRATAFSKNKRSALSQCSPGGHGHSSLIWDVIFVLDRPRTRSAERFSGTLK